MDTMTNARNNSTASAASNSSDMSATSPHPCPQPSVRTRSVAWGTAVVFERGPTTPSDDDIIMVTVRLSNAFRRGSKLGADDLPNRPPARSFLRRLSTRLNMDHAAEKEERYKAVRMPRAAYKRHFRHDAHGNYAGTEPQREWSEEELMATFADYQHAPLSRMVG